MNKISLSIGVAALLIMCGCSEKPKEQEQNKTAQKTQEQSAAAPQSMYGVPATTQEAQQTEQTEPAGDIVSNTPYFGKVLETINGGGYTYAKVDESGNVYWIAGPQTNLTVGSSVSFIEQMVMKDFTSKSLNRTFDHLVFVTAIVPSGGSQASAAPAMGSQVAVDAHANCDHSKDGLKLEPIASDIKVAKHASGYTIEEIYAKKATLKDKSVKVNAKVVKVSKNIMGKDWVHLQDGSGVAGADDIIATAANSSVQVGDAVTASGTIKTDVDLGYGYNFPVLIEDTKFSAL